MRVECESCKQVVTATLAIERGEVVAACPACKAVMRERPQPAAVRPAPVSAATAPEPLVAAWARVDEMWDEAAPHEALFALVAQHGCYAWAAARYREAQGAGRPGAEPRLDRIRRAAEAALLVSATPRPSSAKTPYGSSIALLAILVVVTAMGLVYALLIR